MFFYFFHGSQHNRQGLKGPSFPLPEPPHRLFTGSVTRQQEAAQTLDGNNPAPPEQPAGCGERVAFRGLVTSTINQLQSGTTAGTGIRLGVKATVQRVVILLLAPGTHPEAAHRGLGSVIGDILNNGKAGTTVGAVGERVAVTPVTRRQDFLETVSASGNIRGNQLVFTLFGDALLNLETLITDGCLAGSRDILDVSQGWRQSLQVSQEPVQGEALPLNINLDVPRGIANPTLQMMPRSKLVNEGTKTNPLHHTPNTNFQPQDIRKDRCLLQARRLGDLHYLLHETTFQVDFLSISLFQLATSTARTNQRTALSRKDKITFPAPQSRGY